MGTIARALTRRGRQLVSPPAGFSVDGVQGPLRTGELDRARAWGAALAAAVTADGIDSIDSIDREDPAMSTITTRTDHTDHREDGDRRPGAATARSTLATAPALGRQVDVTRIVTTTEIVVGAVLVARELGRRPGSSKAMVTMGPGGWVSMRGGTVAVRPSRRLWRRVRPLPASRTAVRDVPLWARVISAVPLQRLLG